MRQTNPSKLSAASLVFPEIAPQHLIAPDRPARSRGLERAGAAQARRNPDVLVDPAIKSTTLTFTTIHKHGDLFVDFMRMRHRIFIEAKGWDLPEIDGIEFDQYDTAEARWVAIHSYGDVLAGIRLLPTTSQVGLHSYMLRDAQLGLIDTIPRDILFFEAPVSPLIWEATRLFVSPEVPAQMRAQVQARLMLEMARVAREAGATHVIGIVPSVFRRWLARVGMSASPVGAEMVIDGDKICSALFPVTDFVN